ncbi:MAG TPA: hypothetical protein VFF06_36240 [Polyangia bacterium]|nr:hypothetical protein [Polyangia bacterium]
MIARSRRARLLRHAALALGSLLFAASVCEGLILYALSHPRVVPRLPANVQRGLRYLYTFYDRDIVQLEPAFARFDPELSYTLRPGRFVFANREFANEFRVNSLGVRDEESALVDPEVVVTGDSFAMGWGVGQEQTFARLLERKLGLKVLNASVSSYGAARELKLLDRVSFARVKYVVIQHCENDFEEDEPFAEFARSHGALPADTEARFERRQARFLANRRYWFGRYLFRLLFHSRRDGAAGEPDAPPDWTRRAERLLELLAHGSKQNLDGVQLILFDLGSDPEFVRALDRLRARPSWPRFIQRMKVLDVSAILYESHFYILDDHLNASGHERLAAALADAIRAR